jgi:hypothetical protein
MEARKAGTDNDNTQWNLPERTASTERNRTIRRAVTVPVLDELGIIVELNK